MEYQNIINIFLTEFEKTPIIKVEDLLNLASLNTTNQETKILALQFMIDQNIIKVSDAGKQFLKSTLQLRPNSGKLEIPSEETLDLKVNQICISFPQFDYFGLKEKFQQRNIPYMMLKETFIKIFQSAKQEIRICSPFMEYKGIKPFLDILLQQAQRGIKIKIVSRELTQSYRRNQIRKIIREFSDKKLSKQLFIKNYHYSVDKIHIDSSIHAKFIIADEKVAYIGSGELRENSFEKNLELGVLLQGEDVKYLVYIFDSIFTRGQVIKL